MPGSPSCHATSKSDDGFEDRSHAITAFDDAHDFTPSCRLAQNQQLGREKNKKTSEDEDGSSIEHGSLLGFDCFFDSFYLCFMVSTIEHGCYDY